MRPSRVTECIPRSFQREWDPLAEDGLHDPEGGAMGALQEPSEALRRLPRDTTGDLVDWVAAMNLGEVEPRSTRSGRDAEAERRDTAILMRNTGSAPYVLFPHRPHTAWLDCENCHQEMFEREAGATRFTMLEILQGRYCGRCHGAVAFPLTECNRCHSVSRNDETPIRFCDEASQ